MSCNDTELIFTVQEADTGVHVPELFNIKMECDDQDYMIIDDKYNEMIYAKLRNQITVHNITWKLKFKDL